MTTDADGRPLISVVLSFRNEAEVIDELIARLAGVFEAEDVRYELIFVNDASTDSSLSILKGHAEKNSSVKVLDMSRNFGVGVCVMAGMKYASGDALVYMDADLQDPPEVIPELMAKWRDGADMVYTRRARRDGEPATKLAMTKLAYAVINKISEVDMPIEAGDFRLLSRRALDHLLALEENAPYLRGLTQWIGFERAEVVYRRAPRAAGETHFPLFTKGPSGPIQVFIDGITSFSMFPLYLILIFGILGKGVAGIGLLLTLIAWPIWGLCATAAWVFFALLLWGGLMTGMGVVAIYIARIYRDVRGRPRYIVKDTVNL